MMKEEAMPPITLEIRWIELFGASRKDMSDQVRRERWEAWKRLCQSTDHSETVEWWSSFEDTCLCCEHCDGDWCLQQSLPCTVNPVMTFRTNEIGLACMGIGYREKQLKMNL